MRLVAFSLGCLLQKLHVWFDGELVVVQFLQVLFVPVPPPEEQVVGCTGNDLLLDVTIDLTDPAVVKFVPLLVDGVHPVRRIVAEAHIAVVIGDGVAVVNKWLV